MKEIIYRLIDDFQERDIPNVTPRMNKITWLQRKANVIIGMRRAGKTWFCYQLMHELINQGISKEQILYLNFEDERLLPFKVNDFQHIIDVYYRKFPTLKDKDVYVFFDEIQRIDGWENFIRRILDNERMYVCITGSSAKLLSKEIATSLRGRALSTEIFPYSFTEILQIHKINDLDANSFGTKKRADIGNVFDLYYKKGGFPEVQEVEKTIRYQILRNYIDVVMLRDIIERYQINNSNSLRMLIRHILRNPATQLSVNKFYKSLQSQQIACTKNDLYSFIEYLADAYLVYPISLHSRSQKSRETKPKKIYIIDHGLLHAMSLDITQDKGALLENIVFMHLRRMDLNIDYYITKNGYEIDFVVSDLKGNKSLIQVCHTMLDENTKARELRSIEQAKQELNIENAEIVTWDEEGFQDDIKITPIWQWLLKN